MSLNIYWIILSFARVKEKGFHGNHCLPLKQLVARTIFILSKKH